MKDIKNFKSFVNESVKFSKNKLVICDFQPAYEKYFGNLDKFECMESILKHKGTILYLYNGPDFGYEDTPEFIQNWFFENTESEKIYDKNIIWFEKNYGFFRNVMDLYGIEYTKILLEYMKENKIYQSYQFEESDFENLKGLNLPSDLIDKLESEDVSIDIPTDLLDHLQQFNNCTLIGGARMECLMEVIILMDLYNIEYHLYEKFVY